MSVKNCCQGIQTSGFPGGLVVNNPPANAGDVGLVFGSEISPGEMATHSSILAWEIPWIEEAATVHEIKRSQT